MNYTFHKTGHKNGNNTAMTSYTGSVMDLFLAASLLILLDVGRAQPRPEVTLTQGVVRGKAVRSPATSKQYYAFQRIPFAKPPVGNLRFKDPEPPDPWKGVLDGSVEAPSCMQLGMPFLRLLTTYKEDCLYLNVYTSQLPRNGSNLRRAVMVWIHGGAFISGSGNPAIYGPDYLVEKNVVVVTINYRLGILGFLSLYNDEIPGNMGLKDQVAALRWVQKNIADFGGDPRRVTIFGESAGSASSHLLMLSPMTKGLFQGVICQSGSALNPWAFKASTWENTEILTARVGCGGLDNQTTVACLRGLPASKLAEVRITDATPEDSGREIPIPVWPTIDKTFLPRPPLQIIQSGTYNKVPLVMGVTSGEGLLFLNMYVAHHRKLNIFNSDFERFVPKDLNLSKGSKESKRVAEMMKKFYFKGEHLTMENLNQYKDLSTDRYFLLGTHQAVQMHSRTSNQPIFLYEMAFEGMLNIFKPIFGNVMLKGVCHADDLPYIWFMKIFPIRFPSFTPEMKTVKRLVTLWTNFAKTGNPTLGTSKLLPVEWRLYSVSDPAYLLIDKNLEVRTNIQKNRMDFWNRVYTQYGNSTR